MVRRALGTLFLTEGVFKQAEQVDIAEGRYWRVTDFKIFVTVVATLDEEDKPDKESEIYLVPSTWVVRR